MSVVELGMLVLSCLFFLGSLDDLFLDVVHTIFALKPKKILDEHWNEWIIREEDPIAVMIPAWQEYDVLEAMVKTNLRRIKYKNFHWFIGVYPNDDKTLAIALKMQDLYPEKLTVVINSKPGPTSKAQCLNEILRVMTQGIDNAQKNGEKPWIPRFVAIHDAEDVIHPLSFTAINAQNDDVDFIQVPIFSLPVPTSKWVAGTYLDEFADIHLREVPVREKLNMPIPSAGVGTFFSFRILNLLHKKFGHWFDEGNLTEDYEVSMKISRIGGKQMFLLVKDPLGEVVATREYFPADFGRSIRQKTRWTTGIALQTMVTWGSYGNPLEIKSFKSLLARYGIWRDRKALWANPIIFLAWTVFLLCLTLHLINPQWMSNLSENKLLLNLMILNLFLFCVRLVQRARFTTVLYGVKHGILTFPRLILGGVINGSAALRALTHFNNANKTNKTDQIEWDKTDHFFPDEETLDDKVNLQ
ncbi:MAG TPA: glycosyltransferase [Bacteriovoracaceae bacterium]|nr:glycosyltransferase [Bacteriovoracaceae bacterium]